MKWIAAAAALGLLFANRARAAASLNAETGLYRAENWIYDMTGKRLTISFAGLNLIKRAEGLALAPYKDAAGFWTIGYGHKLQSGEWWDSVSQAEAEALLARDVTDAEDAVNSLVTAPITQSQFDALASFTYNLGPGALKNPPCWQKSTRATALPPPNLAAGYSLEARLFSEGVA